MQEQGFTYEYPRPALTVDCVVFGFDDAAGALDVLLVRRKDDPYKGHLALPGGFVNIGHDDVPGESAEDAARRELQEETGIKPDHLEQLYTFGDPERDPRGWVVSVAHLALVRTADHDAVAGSDAIEARWARVDKAMRARLAFDHNKILRVGVERLRGKVTYSPIAFSLLPEAFSLSDAHRLYEALLQRKLDLSNFRKRLSRLGVLKPAGVRRSRAGGRVPALYSYDPERLERLGKLGFFFDLQPKRRRGRTP